MRLLESENGRPLYQVQLYLTPREADELVRALSGLLKHPEAFEHDHVFGEDGSREVSISLVTPAKLANLRRYTPAEQRMFRER